MPKFLTELERDKLAEVVNIGAEHAGTALSQMVKKRITISVPEVIVDKVEKVLPLLGKTDETVTAVLLKIRGEAPGMIFLLFPPASAFSLSRLLRGQPKSEHTVLDELDISALKEVGNILSGASLTALSRFVDLNLLQSVPDTATDMLGALFDGLLAELGQLSDIVLVFRVSFSVESEINGQLFFLFDANSSAKILARAGTRLRGV